MFTTMAGVGIMAGTTGVGTVVGVMAVVGTATIGAGITVMDGTIGVGMVAGTETIGMATIGAMATTIMVTIGTAITGVGTTVMVTETLHTAMDVEPIMEHITTTMQTEPCRVVVAITIITQTAVAEMQMVVENIFNHAGQMWVFNQAETTTINSQQEVMAMIVVHQEITIHNPHVTTTILIVHAITANNHQDHIRHNQVATTHLNPQGVTHRNPQEIIRLSHSAITHQQEVTSHRAHTLLVVLVEATIVAAAAVGQVAAVADVGDSIKTVL